MEKLIIGSHVSFTKDDGMLGSVREALSSWREHFHVLYRSSSKHR